MLAEPPMRANLLTLFAAYVKATKSAVSSASREIHGDTPFFADLKKLHARKNRVGRTGSFTARKYDDMLLAFALRWPLDCQWPDLLPIYPPSDLHELQIAAENRLKKLERTKARV